jgi:SNF2 family DNA or RNA helicase
MQVSTGKFGLNLSSASTAIYFSNSLRPEDRIQSEYRIEANNKKEPLLYVDLLTKGTVDERILNVLKKKQTHARDFLSGVVEELRKDYENIAA